MPDFYRFITGRLEPALDMMLGARLKSGKEITGRTGERKGEASLPRPPGFLFWLHAASVGEAQSALILLERLARENQDAHVLVTTGTASSARVMQDKLPAHAIHQFSPWDHPTWVKSFIHHWRPDFILWMESELWPNMLAEIREGRIPAALVNARLSDKSFSRWRLFKSWAKEILSAFTIVIAQTPEDAARFKALAAPLVIATDNIKYSAKPLSCDDDELTRLSTLTNARPLWLFASTHKGEESMALRLHQQLAAAYPDLLTIIVPRHPERRAEIAALCEKSGLAYIFRSPDKKSPPEDADIYIADTMGELGLFYRLAPIACIGRSFSDDGGGGHNPVEAAQLNCAVLHGPHVQFQRVMYDEMDAAGAALKMRDENDLAETLRRLFSDPDYLESRRAKAFDFARRKEPAIERVMDVLRPLVDEARENAS